MEHDAPFAGLEHACSEPLAAPRALLIPLAYPAMPGYHETLSRCASMVMDPWSTGIFTSGAHLDVALGIPTLTVTRALSVVCFDRTLHACPPSRAHEEAATTIRTTTV
eukprot:2333828-Rhodomonas_salina.1